MRRPVLLLPVVLLPVLVLAFGSTGARGRAQSAGATATALAVKISVPGQPDVTTQSVSAPPAVAPAAGKTFAYPGDGSIVSVASTTASATTTIAKNAGAKAESDATGISLFGGELKADAVTARASAGTGYADAGGNFLGSTVVNLTLEGQPVTVAASPGQHVALGTWGTLTIGAQGIDRSAPPGAHGYRGDLTELDVHLSADHGGLPAGSEIQIGFAEAAAQTAPPSETTTTAPAAPVPSPTTTEPDQPLLGDSPRTRAHETTPKGGVHPLKVHPKLTAGHYVFPVYGPASYVDTFGAARSDVSYHHGDDIFGQLGQPLVACADGTIFSVGWNTIGGNRLWIRDDAGNEYYYAHLSAFSTLAVNGARVKAGQVVGFMGNTGDAEGTPVHLHFEVHPVSFLYLGYDGAVDPTAYLEAWQHAKDLPFPIAAGWAPAVPGGSSAPEPGAMLLGMSDISSGDGLDPASLRRAMLPPKQLLQPLVPSALPPTGDLGSHASAGA